MANEKDANVEFSSYEIDAVGEILNISMGSAATAVSELLNAKVWITTPQVSVVKAADLNTTVWSLLSALRSSMFPVFPVRT